MDEIRKNHIVQLISEDNTVIEGIVFDYDNDRVSVLVAYDSLLLAGNIKELDLLRVKVNTHLGIKEMNCHVIAKLNANNCIVVENNETIPVEQKREFVRVLSNIAFKILKDDNKIIECYCINISAGGIAFCVNNEVFKINELVNVILPKEEFDTEITACGKIIKNYDNCFVAQFINLSSYNEDKIMKHVFKLIAKK